MAQLGVILMVVVTVVGLTRWVMGGDSLIAWGGVIWIVTFVWLVMATGPKYLTGGDLVLFSVHAFAGVEVSRRIINSTFPRFRRGANLLATVTAVLICLIAISVPSLIRPISS